MSTNDTLNKKNGPCMRKDAQLNTIQLGTSEMTFRGEYTGTNLIYRAFARPGAAEGDNVWQIAKLAYDGSNNLLSVKWPQDSNGIATPTYEFNWTGRAGYTYS